MTLETLPPDLKLPVLQKKNRGHENLRPGMGRLKGSVNRVSRDLKNGLIDAAIALGADGEGAGGLQGYLMYLGRSHPKAFAALLGKTIPLNVGLNADVRHCIGTVNIVSIPHDHYLSAADVERYRTPGFVEHVAPFAPPEAPAASADDFDNMPIEELMRRAGVANLDQS